MTKSRNITKRYTAAEDEILKEMFHTYVVREIAEKLNRTKGSVHSRIKVLGLELSKKEKQRRKMMGIVHLEKHGKAFRYPKGHVPANKGKKIPRELQSEGMKANQFKKGNIPVNALSDGNITIRHPHKKRGSKRYKFIRIGPKKWEYLHRYNWEKTHGPIPKGFNVVFKNEDTMDCEPHNLELVSDAGLLNKNRLTQWPLELQKVIKLNNKLKKQIHG